MLNFETTNIFWDLDSYQENPDFFDMIVSWARDIWINIDVEFVSRSEFDSKWWVFFEVEKNDKNEIFKYPRKFVLWDESVSYDWIDIDWNMYKKEADWNRWFVDWEFVKLEMYNSKFYIFNEGRKEYLWKTFTKYPPYKKLYLPDDLNYFDLPSIISKLAEKVYKTVDVDWNEVVDIPKDSASYQIQAYLIQTIMYVYNLDEAKEDWVFKPEYKKLLKKLYLLYSKNFDVAFDDLNNPLWNITKLPIFLDKVKSCRDVVVWAKSDLNLLDININRHDKDAVKFSLKKYRWQDNTFYWRVHNQYDKYQEMLELSVDPTLFESVIEDKIKIWFDHVLFEHWSSVILDYMTWTTLVDKSKYNVISIEETISSRLESFLSKVEWWEVLTQLEQVDCMKIIFNEIEEMPLLYEWNNTWELDEVFDTQEIQCLLWSIIAHSYLWKLWIKHNSLMMSNHVALLVYVWDKKYYFDWVNYYLDEFDVDEDDWFTNTWYADYLKHEWTDLDNFDVEEWDASDLLLFWLYNNFWMNVSSSDVTNLYIIYLSNALNIMPDDYSIRCLRWLIYGFNWELEKAIDDLTYAITLDEASADVYFSRWLFYSLMLDYDKAIEDYSKWIILDNEYLDLYLYRSDSFYKVWDYAASIKDLEKIIGVEWYERAYYSIWDCYLLMWEYEKSIYYYKLWLKKDNSVLFYNNNIWFCNLQLWEYEEAEKRFIFEMQLWDKINSSNLEDLLTLEKPSNAYLLKNISLMYYFLWDIGLSKKFYDKMKLSEKYIPYEEADSDHFFWDDWLYMLHDEFEFIE